MSGKKGRSGPPGHLHNSRHPWRSFWRRRALRAEDRWILPTLEGYASGLANDKPGATEGELRMIEIAQVSRGATMLILAECARSGFMRKDGMTWDLSPGAKELAKFLSVERSALQTLKLERRVKPALSLSQYLEAKAPTPKARPVKATIIEKEPDAS